MRTPIIAGKWKMNKNVNEDVDLVSELRRLVLEVEKVEMVGCPPFVALAPVADVLEATKCAGGAHNLYWGDKGDVHG